MKRLAALVLAVAIGCRASPLEGRWQGGSDSNKPPPPDGPVAMSFTLHQSGDSLHGWGVARTDGGSFPITARGSTRHTHGGPDSTVVVAISISPWRAGVVEVLAAQVQGTLTARGEVTGTLRTDGGFGPGGGTPIVLRRP
jgi:hypothetical protein